MRDALDELEKEAEYLDSQLVYREIIMRTFNKDVDKIRRETLQ